MNPGPDPFPAWFEALEARQRADLTFPEIRRALQALSSLYVERRGAKLAEGAVFEGAGKRAAFALFYGPLHFLLVREVVAELEAQADPPRRIHDLGCGTGVAGAAWALAAGGAPELAGIDRSGWAVTEARWTYSALRLRGTAHKGDLERVQPGPQDGVVAAFTVNELPDPARNALLARLVSAAQAGTRILVLEPLARGVAPWWTQWATAFAPLGGITRECRYRVELPDTLKLLDKAAGLDHRELSGRALWVRRSAS